MRTKYFLPFCVHVYDDDLMIYSANNKKTNVCFSVLAPRGIMAFQHIRGTW